MDHQIPIELVVDSMGREHAVLTIPTNMQVGDTVRYSCSFGSFRLEFYAISSRSGLPSPFPDGTSLPVTTPASLPLTNGGVFVCHCFVTKLPSGVKIGWN